MRRSVSLPIGCRRSRRRRSLIRSVPTRSINYQRRGIRHKIRNGVLESLWFTWSISIVLLTRVLPLLAMLLAALIRKLLLAAATFLLNIYNRLSAPASRDSIISTPANPDYLHPLHNNDSINSPELESPPPMLTIVPPQPPESYSSAATIAATAADRASPKKTEKTLINHEQEGAEPANNTSIINDTHVNYDDVAASRGSAVALLNNMINVDGGGCHVDNEHNNGNGEDEEAPAPAAPRMLPPTFSELEETIRHLTAESAKQSHLT